jgi:lantibiotic leader peptide-processing serine protease
MRPMNIRLTAFAGLVSLWMVGCDGGGSDLMGFESTEEALATSQSFLISFTSDSIPGNVDALVAGAGGSIVARYSALGAVLASSGNLSFASVLRATTGVDSVGATKSVLSKLSLPSGKRTPHGKTIAHGRSSGDPLSFRQWNMDQIHAPQAHAISLGKKSVLVGLLDTGVDTTHPDMVGQVDSSASVSCVGGVPNTAITEWGNDIFGHGTHVAGIVAAAKNGVGVVGVAPGVRMAAIKVVDDNGAIFPEAFVCGMDWAASHSFDVLNASFTVDPFFFYCSDEPDQLAIIKLVRRAVLKAASKKVTLVAAAGNNFTDLSSLRSPTGGKCKVLPVQLPRVIGVSAVGFAKRLAWYSDYGAGAVDLTGPGGDDLIPDSAVTDRASSGQVLSSISPNSIFYQAAAGWDGQVQDCSSGPCSTYAYLEGTSQAAPHVVGVAALAISRFGKMSPEALLAVLSLTAKPLPCPVGAYDPGMTGTPATCVGPVLYNSFYGAGEADAFGVVR